MRWGHARHRKGRGGISNTFCTSIQNYRMQIRVGNSAKNMRNRGVCDVWPCAAASCAWNTFFR